MGLMTPLRKWRWGLAVAGASVRYRKRVTAFQRIGMRTRLVGWDHRFVHIVQSMWDRGTCTGEALLRMAVTSPAGTVPPVDIVAALGWRGETPEMPGRVQGWIETEAARPWPPQPVSDGHVPPTLATAGGG